MKTQTDAEIRQAAKDLYAMDSNEDIQVDEDASVVDTHIGEDGVKSWWVQAWVYVREEDLSDSYQVPMDDEACKRLSEKLEKQYQEGKR